MNAPGPTILAVLALGLAGCGGEDGADQTTTPPAGGAAATTPAETAETGMSVMEEEQSDAELARRPEGEEGLRVPAARAQIVVQESDFGRVLFDANGQVVYAFENDRRNESNCTSADCVQAWPPVLTEEQPTAGAGADAELLGTIGRADGTLQVTYAGRPLYFYEHEGPGEIKCHNINLHGGLWWVVTPGGDPVA